MMVTVDGEQALAAKRSARGLANRLLAWGLLAGIALGFAQLAAVPLLGALSPLEDVQRAARVPSIIGALLQSINGLVFVGEGIMQGTGSFLRLAAGNAVATGGMLLALQVLARPVAQGGFEARKRALRARPADELL